MGTARLRSPLGLSPLATAAKHLAPPFTACHGASHNAVLYCTALHHTRLHNMHTMLRLPRQLSHCTRRTRTAACALHAHNACVHATSCAPPCLLRRHCVYLLCSTAAPCTLPYSVPHGSTHSLPCTAASLRSLAASSPLAGQHLRSERPGGVLALRTERVLKSLPVRAARQPGRKSGSQGRLIG